MEAPSNYHEDGSRWAGFYRPRPDGLYERANVELLIKHLGRDCHGRIDEIETGLPRKLAGRSLYYEPDISARWFRAPR